MIISKISKNHTLLIAFQQQICNYLRGMLSKLTDPAIMQLHRPSVIRFLIVAGLLCRHYDYDEENAKKALVEEEEGREEDDDDDDGEMARKSPEEENVPQRILDVMLQVLTKFGVAVDVGVNSKCLVGLGHLLIRKPSLMLIPQVDSIINECLLPCTPFSFKVNLLRSFCEMLRDEEEKSKFLGGSLATQKRDAFQIVSRPSSTFQWFASLSSLFSFRFFF